MKKNKYIQCLFLFCYFSSIDPLQNMLEII